MIKYDRDSNILYKEYINTILHIFVIFFEKLCHIDIDWYDFCRSIVYKLTNKIFSIMKKNEFEKMVNDQLLICNSVYHNDNYEKYNKSIQMKKNTGSEFDFFYPTENGSCWCITVLYDDGSYSSRRMFTVGVDVKDNGSNNLDIDSIYERYKKINR